MSEKKSDPSRTEILHSEDHLDYPLDVPSSSDDRTTAFPVAPTPGPTGSTGSTEYPGTTGHHERTSVDALAPLPYGEDEEDTRWSGRDTGVTPRGTTDLGLLALRLVVGVLLGMRGLQKLFGLFDGPGVDGFGTILQGAGFKYHEVLSVAGGAVELVAAVALVIGLITPVAASALLGVIGLGLAIQITQPGTPAILGEGTKGLETALLYAGALLALLFAGPGRLSVDRRWRWSHRPRFSGFIWLFVTIVAAATLWYLLNGSNPLGADSAPAPAPAPAG